MSDTTRYIPSRGTLGSPIVRDTESRRPVLVCLREIQGGEAAPSKAADEAAMAMARTCAQALNRAHAEEAWRRQNEKGR